MNRRTVLLLASLRTLPVSPCADIAAVRFCAEPPPPAPVKAKPQPAQFYMDGVFLSESGMHQIKALTIEQPKRQRARRPRVPSGGPPPTPTLAGAFGAFRGRLSTEDSEDGSKGGWGRPHL